MKKNYKGFTLVEIMIVVAIIGLLIAIALPNFVIARKRSMMNACKANMKQIDGAIQQALINGVTNIGTTITTTSPLIPDYIKDVPVCKAGGTYTIDPTVSTNSVTCSYVDADYPHTLSN
jgi:prepilin-type N-terminal cleavage/methylation domain-containing protein